MHECFKIKRFVPESVGDGNIMRFFSQIPFVWILIFGNR